MAVSANFKADFTSFLNAVKDADVKLADFGSGAEKVQTKLSKMVDSFQGRAVIQEAVLMGQAITKIGGNAQLSTADLQKFANKSSEAADIMKRLGLEGAEGMRAIADGAKAALPQVTEVGAQVKNTTGVLGDLEKQLVSVFSVGSIIAFGKEVLDAGDRIQKMADQTGLSTAEVQKLDFIAGQSGTSIESLIGAVQNLQVRLGDENSGAAGAFAKLGIEMDSFSKLNTYQQMTLLGDAIKDIKDPTEQASVSAAIFGKSWKEILPAIKSGMKEVGDQATIMGDDTVKSLDRIGDTLKAAKQAATAWGGSFVVAIEGAGFAVGDFLSKFDPSHFGVTNTQLLKLAGAINDPDGLAGALSKVPPKALAVGDALKSVALKSGEAAEVSKQLTRQGNESIKMHEEAAKAAEKHAAAIEKFKNSVEGISFKTFIADNSKLQAQIPDLSKHIEEMAGKFAEARDQMDDLEAEDISYNTAQLETVAGAEKLYTAFSKLPNVVAQSTDEINKATTASASFSDTLRGSLIDALGQIPKQLERAFTGGGNIAGAIKAISTGVGAAVGSATGQSIAKSLGGDLGKALGSVMPGVGAVAGATLADSTSGVLSNTLSGAAIGTLILPGIGTAIGAAAGAIVGGLKKLFNDVEKAVNPVRQAFVDAAGGLAELNLRAHDAGVTLDALLNAKNPEAYTKAINDLNAAFKFQDDAMKTLDDTVQKYGFTIQELGPAFAAQKLSEQAGSLLQDYQVLTAAGVDHVAIIEKMGPALNNYVKTSILAGTAIPSSLKPVLQSMVDLGELTDENGDKMTDLSKLTFAETLDKKFSSLIDTINKLTDAISRGLGTAIQNIPQPNAIHVPVVYDYPPVDNGGGNTNDNFAAHGGLVTTSGVQYLAGGGRVLAWPSRGSDTVPAMLTPGEGVVSRRGMATLGKAGLAAINKGAVGNGSPSADMSDLQDSFDALAQALADRDRLLPKIIRDAVLLAPRTAA